MAQTLVELADTLVDHFDVIDMLTLVADRCVEVLEIDAAGIALANPRGALQPMASSNAGMHELEEFAVRTKEGPQHDCFASGEKVVVPDVSECAAQWPEFASLATELKYRCSVSLPLRLRGTVLGTLTLVGTETLSEDDQRLAQAFADVASISLLHDRAANEQQIVNAQLQHALTSRVAVEQAKGVVAERHDIGMDEAFERLRAYARSRRIRLSEVVQGVLDRSIRL